MKLKPGDHPPSDRSPPPQPRSSLRCSTSSSGCHSSPSCVHTRPRTHLRCSQVDTILEKQSRFGLFDIEILQGRGWRAVRTILQSPLEVKDLWTILFGTLKQQTNSYFSVPVALVVAMSAVVVDDAKVVVVVSKTPVNDLSVNRNLKLKE